MTRSLRSRLVSLTALVVIACATMFVGAGIIRRSPRAHDVVLPERWLAVDIDGDLMPDWLTVVSSARDRRITLRAYPGRSTSLAWELELDGRLGAPLSAVRRRSADVLLPLQLDTPVLVTVRMRDGAVVRRQSLAGARWSERPLHDTARGILAVTGGEHSVFATVVGGDWHRAFPGRVSELRPPLVIAGDLLLAPMDGWIAVVDADGMRRETRGSELTCAGDSITLLGRAAAAGDPVPVLRWDRGRRSFDPLIAGGRELSVDPDVVEVAGRSDHVAALIGGSGPLRLRSVAVDGSVRETVLAPSSWFVARSPLATAEGGCAGRPYVPLLLQETSGPAKLIRQEVVVVDTRSAEVVWRQGPRSPVEAPATHPVTMFCAGGRHYIAQSPSRLLVVDATSGRLRRIDVAAAGGQPIAPFAGISPERVWRSAVTGVTPLGRFALDWQAGTMRLDESGQLTAGAHDLALLPR